MPEPHAGLQSVESIAQLEEMLSEPTPALVGTMRRISGDIIVLGVAGKMGPTLARMARRAADQAGTRRRVIGVSRFSDASSRQSLESHGIETIAGDLLDPRFMDSLPDAPLVVYAAGMKFGSTGNEPLTWAINTLLPSLVCRRYAQSRIVAFSTGNVYGATAATRGGSLETDPPNPLGEYAMSCLGRERMFEYFSRVHGVSVALVRLNYATELRYGVLIDLGQKVWNQLPIDLSMGFVNVIWQGDANTLALGLLEHTTTPAAIFNLAGPETLRIRNICERFGSLMSRPLRLVGAECPDALLSNAGKLYQTVGTPAVDIEQMIAWSADWIARGGATHGKPTHFEVRTGKF